MATSATSNTLWVDRRMNIRKNQNTRNHNPVCGLPERTYVTHTHTHTHSVYIYTTVNWINITESDTLFLNEYMYWCNGSSRNITELFSQENICSLSLSHILVLSADIKWHSLKLHFSYFRWLFSKQLWFPPSFVQPYVDHSCWCCTSGIAIQSHCRASNLASIIANCIQLQAI